MLFQLPAPLPVVDNNRKVIGALSVVREKCSNILAKLFAKISEIFEQKVEQMLHFGKIPKHFGQNLARFRKKSANSWQNLKFFARNQQTAQQI